MKTLVLCVDRDDDFGNKAGLNSPFIGREENFNAAIALGLKDPEDSDVNTLLAAIIAYDEMSRKGVEVEIATICGDQDVGYESDIVLATQLETVLDVVKPDRIVLVSDGAEDEFIYPMVSSRAKVDSVRKVFVKQAPTIEGSYYIIMKMLHDDKIRKRILAPIALAMLVFGAIAMLDHVLKFMQDGPQAVSFSSVGFVMVIIVVGLYLLSFAYKLGDRGRQWWGRARRAARSGSQIIPFAVLAVLLAVMGVVYGYDSAISNTGADLLQRSLVFMSSALWMLVFAYFAFQMGLFINHYLAKGEVSYGFVIVSITTFAVGFIVQGSLDAAEGFFKYRDYEWMVILLEIVIGFLLAVFGGLLNSSISPPALDEPQPEAERGAEATD